MSTKPKATDQTDPTSGNVEQIREILFGGHIRAFDERFDLVESRLSKESDALRKALEKRILELERLLNEFRDEARDGLGAETNNRDLALNKMELALASARIDAENEMAQLQDNFAAEIKAVRAELGAAQKELNRALNSQAKTLTRHADRTEADKVDRKELSRFFTDIAQKIQPDKAGKSK